ncbi:methyltransferase domain-containing protein [Asanoa sp. NPDC050611]|uniref:class I SAM-dependent methyltransferase n=1 Tax=Asanoa sp. NPDC050611 TaxID=3157098 RepID=UPI0034108BE5
MIGPAWTLFDRVAADYDGVLPFFADFGRAIVDAVDPPAGCRFLDLGAGRGALTGPALARGCRVTAVDAAPAMCTRLRADHPGAEVHVMDAQALDLPAGGYDVVAASFVIHVLDDPAAGVAEAYRVLAPGGRFAFTGGSARGGTGPDLPAPSLGTRMDALFMEFATHLPPGGSMGRPVDAADLLAEAGFVDLREDHAAVAVTVADNGTLWRWILTHGYRAFVEDLPADRRAEFRQRVLALPTDDRVLRRVTPVWSGRKPA